MLERLYNPNLVIATIILLSLSVMINILRVGPICISMIIVLIVSFGLLCSKFYGFYKDEIFIYLFMLYIMFIGNIHVSSFRLSTVLYTYAFMFTFILYTRLIKEKSFTREYYLKLIKYLVYAYTIVLIIQQFCVLTGLPILNLGNYNTRTPYKLNALTLEPAHSSIMIGILLLSFIRIKELMFGRKYNISDAKKEDRLIWFACSYSFLLNGSVLSYIAFGIILSYFIRIKNIVWILPLLFAFIGTIYYFSDDYFVFNRLTKVTEALLTMDDKVLKAADGSASARIVPWFWYFQDVKMLSFDTWIGYGTDSASKLYNYKLTGYANVSSNYVGGFFPSYVYDNGLIVLLLFTPILKNFCLRKWISLELLVWLVLINPSPINSYLFWFGMMMLFTNKYFYNQQYNSENENSIYTCTSDKGEK